MSSRIQRFEFIRGFGSFRDWEHASHEELPDFKRYNLIYGWNGSGKTMLSRVFQTMETGSLPDFVDADSVEIEVVRADEKVLSIPTAGETNPPIRVFNEDFVETNLLFKDAAAEPILILGEESIEAAAALDTHRKNLADQTPLLEAATDERKAVVRSLDSLLIDTAQNIKGQLTRGSRSRYNDYHKGDVRKALEALDEDAERVEIDVATERSHLDGTARGVLEVGVAPEVDVSLATWTRMSALLQTELIDTSVEGLREDHDVQSWVKRGLELHADKDDQCLFCAHELTAERLATLREHFSSEFSALVTKLDALIVEHEQVTAEVSKYSDDVESINEDRLYPDLLADWKGACAELDRAKIAIDAQLTSNVSSLTNKSRDPFSMVEMPKTLESMQETAKAYIAATSRIERCIDDHVERTESIDQLLERAQTKLEADMVWSINTSYLDKMKSIDDHEGIIETIRDKIRSIEDDIDEIEAEQSGQQYPCDVLNGSFAAFFGHGLFEVQPARGDEDQNRFVLLREGEPAENLSEGERSGIALVYFLTKLTDESTDLSQTVVVIDDPVSSHDSRNLYQAFSFVHRHTYDAMQLFILTHDFRLFRLVMGRFNHDDQYKESRAVFMVVRRIEDGRSRSALEACEPTLKNHDSEYHYLYVLVKRLAEAPQPSISDAQGMPNVMRRLLEAFFAFKKPTQQKLETKLREASDDSRAVERIVRFVNDRSHTGSIGSIDRFDPIDSGEAQDVAQAVMTLIKNVDCEHAAAMNCNS